MAEIKIEKKKPIWPWILLALLVLAAILYFFVFGDSANRAVINNTADTSVVMTNVQANDDAVMAYIHFIRADTADMSKDHEYSNEALRKLTNATEKMANKAEVDIKANLDEAKQLAKGITQNPDATSHANDIRKAADILSTALGTIQNEKFHNLSNESQKLKTDAAAIDVNDLTLDQKGTIKTFYNSAADLLQKMNINQ